MKSDSLNTEEAATLFGRMNEINRRIGLRHEHSTS